MTFTKSFAALLLAAGLFAQKPDAAQSALKAAIDKEVADGDLKAAIALYGKVAANHKHNKAVAQEALVRMGQCHEKLGDQEARKVYERALREFPGQTRWASTAQARLAALGRGADALAVRLVFSDKGIRFNASRISGNGQVVPFVGPDGNIYVRDIAANSSRKVSSRPTGEVNAYGWAPKASRDGARVAYGWNLAHNEFELRVAGTAGGESRVVKRIDGGGWLSPMDWTPDGKSLAVWDSSTPTAEGIAMINMESGEMRPVQSRRGWRCWHGSFSPDGRQLAADCTKDLSMNPNWDLVVFDATTGAETVLLAEAASETSPVWIGESGNVAFLSNRQGRWGVWQISSKGGSQPVLLHGDVGESVLLGAGVDGALYYAKQNQSSDVYLTNFDAATRRGQGEPVRIVSSFLGQNRSPAWSPSGTLFGYASRRDINGQHRLVVRTPEGKETVSSDPLRWAGAPHWCAENRVVTWGTPSARTRRIYDVATGLPAGPDVEMGSLKAPYQLGFSPDCRTAFVSSFNAETKRRRIYKIDLESKQETELFADDADWSLAPTVSPDGRWLALVGRERKGGPNGVIVLPTQGGAPKLLAPNASDNQLNWSPDSKTVFFVSGPRNTEQEVFAVPVSGGPVTATGIRGQGLSGLSLHPDGKRALYSAVDLTGEVWSLRNYPVK